MRRLTAAQVNVQKIAELGLDPSALDLTSVEAIAGALRRAAGFLCPCPPLSLVRSVVRPLRGLTDDLQLVKTIAEDILDALVAHGDLFEFQQLDDDADRASGLVLYAAPPSFVARASGAVILLGIAPDHLSALPDGLQTRVQYEGYVRRISAQPEEDLRAELSDLGLIEVSATAWLKTPTDEAPAQLVAHINSLLDATPPSHDVPGLTILDTERPVRYYRGRWTEPKARSGRFMARRRQAYGADLWCYVELLDGNPVRLIDFPISAARWRGCDEAWRLQLAIDAVRGAPQQYRIAAGPPRSTVLQLFSPVPMWARRRWNAIAEPVPSSGCLFAYRLQDSELEEELKFARNSLWMGEAPAGEKRR
jgi:hypothetical protein